MAIKQKYIVMLDDSPNRQVFLAYDSLGRIGNASHEQAFRYDTQQQAYVALASVRRFRHWPKAKILGVIVETEES